MPIIDIPGYGEREKFLFFVLSLSFVREVLKRGSPFLSSKKKTSKTQTSGSLAAERACEEFGVASQNDAKKLADAKAAVYLKGFTEGVMLVGDLAGEKVSDAKPKLKASLVAAGDGLIYSEPERAVVSRSGDACVVALTDQWYLTYGEDEWAASARECLSGKNVFLRDKKQDLGAPDFYSFEKKKNSLTSALNTYGDECRHAFEHTLGWLRQWACSRSFGLGTRLPWDPSYLVRFSFFLSCF